MTKIILDQVNKTIKKAVILENINIELEGGHIYGLRGSNGSGKTMLMRTICGLIIPDSGEINIDGDILGKTISFPKSIGALIENPSFINGYTGFKNLKLLASIQGKIHDVQIYQALESVGLNPEDKRTYKKYSLGMKQRLGIACAIMENPDIIILDEPVNALDESGIELVRKLLIEHRARGAVIIIACHDREELELLSDEIYEIYEGKITNHYLVKESFLEQN